MFSFIQFLPKYQSEREMNFKNSANIESVNRSLSKKGEVWLNLSRILEPTEIDYFEALVSTFENRIFLSYRVKVHDNMIRVAPIPVFPNFIQHLNDALWKAIDYNERLKRLERLEDQLHNLENGQMHEERISLDPEIEDFARESGIPIV